MKLLQTIRSARQWRSAVPASAPVIFVPTMGALHEGHLSLVRHARKLAAARRGGKIAVSIYVNPTQFNLAEDLADYPRPIERDIEALYDEKVHAVFLPTTEALYEEDHSAWVVEQRLSEGLCGASRPGHFRGVCTIVAKFFNILRPTAAVFGEKDFQQLAVIRRMTRDLAYPIKIVGRPTMREPDGLAMSSRNVHLNAAERRQAPALHRALAAGVQAARTSPTSASRIVKLIGRELAAHASLAKFDYVEIVDGRTLDPLRPAQPVSANAGLRIIAAAYFGTTRLIDNIAV